MSPGYSIVGAVALELEHLGANGGLSFAAVANLRDHLGALFTEGGEGGCAFFLSFESFLNFVEAGEAVFLVVEHLDEGGGEFVRAVGHFGSFRLGCGGGGG